MEKFCATCGRDLAKVPRPKGGRPRKHCDKACREFAAALATFFKYLDVFRERATRGVWREFRGKVFQFLNARAWNEGVPGITNGCARDKRGRLVGKSPAP